MLFRTFVAVLFLFCCISVFAQEDEVLRVDTQLVEVPVTVTDKFGKPIFNLKKANFRVFEDERAQDIESFAATSAPFEIALLLDTSGSARSELPLIRLAANAFISSLRPGDKVAVIAFEAKATDKNTVTSSKILTNLTADRDALRNAVDQVTTSNATPYYQSLLQISEEIFNKPAREEFRGRRAIVALTDGVDSAGGADFDSAKEMLLAADIASYFIRVDTRDFFESNLLGDCNGAMRFSTDQIKRYYSIFGSGSKIEKKFDFCKMGDFERLAVSKWLYKTADAEMNELATSSGGKVFPIAGLSGARAAFKQVADEIGSKYSISYYPSNDKSDGTFRKIRVEIKGLPAGAKVRAKEGYTAKNQ